MNRFDGTAARQLTFVDAGEVAVGTRRPAQSRAVPSLQLLKKDVYAELTRRRRRAQIAARHLLEREA